MDRSAAIPTTYTIRTDQVAEASLLAQHLRQLVSSWQVVHARTHAFDGYSETVAVTTTLPRNRLERVIKRFGGTIL